MISVFQVEFLTEYFVNQLFLVGIKQIDASVLSLPSPLSFPRFLSGGASAVCSLVSHGPQGGRAGDAAWFGHGAPHPAAPAFTPLPILLSALHYLLPTATATTNQGKAYKT